MSKNCGSSKHKETLFRKGSKKEVCYGFAQKVMTMDFCGWTDV